MQTLAVALLSLLALQTPATQQPPPAPTAPKKPQTAGTVGRDRTVTRPSLTVTVTDMSGQPIQDVSVRASGPVDRQGTTDAKGTVVLRNVTSGTYRLRFEHENYVTFEREITHGTRASNVAIALSGAPAKPEDEPREEPKPEPPASPPLPPAGPPTFVSIPDFVEKHYVGSAPVLTSPVGCVPAATSKVIQLREPLAEHTHPDADELIYVVAGEGTHRIKGNEIALAAGMFVTIPRGTAHSITRKGRNPIIMLSVTTEPCQPTSNGR